MALVVLLAWPALGRAEKETPPPSLGPMQINSFWLPAIARSTGISRRTSRAALIQQDCFNVAVAGVILRIYLNEAGGNLPKAIGYYHSHTPAVRVPYQRRVMRYNMDK